MNTGHPVTVDHALRQRYHELELAVHAFERLSPIQQATQARQLITAQLAFLGLVVDAVVRLDNQGKT